MGCLSALFRLALIGAPAGLALYLNSAIGWLIAACTVLILFCLHEVRDELVRNLPAQLEAYFEHRPRELMRQRDIEEFRRNAAQRKRWLQEQWIVLDAKVEHGLLLSDEERGIYDEANHARDIRASEMRRGVA